MSGRGGLPGDATRERLLAAAARHFGAFGLAGASLRRIQADAGVNAAAVHYHFGSKEALYRAVLQRFLGPILEDRARAMAAIPSGLTGRERLDILVLAYIRPHVEAAARDDGLHYARMLARVLLDESTDVLFADAVRSSRALFLDELSRLFPEASAETRGRAVGFLVALMAAAPFDATYQALTGRPPLADGVDAVAAAVARFAAGGLETLCRAEDS